MIKGETASGFKFEIEPADINDMEFLERLGIAFESDITKVPGIMTEILGADQRARLYDHLRNERGKVPIEKAMETFQEILTIANESTEGKN